ncbi:hypothetical protein D3C72_1931630 [compost metagenome]
MLARAIVVQGARLSSRRPQRLAGRGIGWRMRPAFEVRCREANAGQQAIGRGDMLGLAMVAGAGQRQFFLGMMEPLIRMARENRQRLHGLDGRTRKNGALEIAR